MRAEIHRPGEPGVVVAVAGWSPTDVTLDVRDQTIQGLDRVLRPTPVVVDETWMRQPGTRGERMLHPGSVEWFREALLQRAEGELGLAVRYLAEDVRNGWDPASNYRTFAEQARRLVTG